MKIYRCFYILAIIEYSSFNGIKNFEKYSGFGDCFEVSLQSTFINCLQQEHKHMLRNGKKM